MPFKNHIPPSSTTLSYDRHRYGSPGSVTKIDTSHKFTMICYDNSKSISSVFRWWSCGQSLNTPPSTNQWTKLKSLEITALRLVVSAHKGTNSSINGSPKNDFEGANRKVDAGSQHLHLVRVESETAFFPCLTYPGFIYFIPVSILTFGASKTPPPKITFIVKVVTHEFPYYPLKKQMPLAGYFCHIMWPIHCREIWPKRWQIKLHARAFRSFSIHSHPIGFLVPREKTHILLG